MHRYLAVYRKTDNPHAREIWSAFLQKIERTPPLGKKIFYRNNFSVIDYSTPDTNNRIHYMENNSGLILGHLFEGHPDGTNQEASIVAQRVLPSKETDEIIKSRGASLIRNYWGSYIALFIDKNNNVLNVFRSPMGTIPLYHYSTPEISLLFSDISMISLFFQDHLEIDWQQIAYRLQYPYTMNENTGFKNLKLLHHAQLLTITPASDAYKFMWCPSDFCATSKYKSPSSSLIEHLAQRIRNTVFSCTQTWMREHPKSLIQLSDGFDSSLITGVISKVSETSQVVCVTCSDAPDTDMTLAYARNTAGQAGYHHHVIDRRAAALSVDNLSNCLPTPWPVLLGCDDDVAHAESKIAHSYGLRTRIRGDGGDCLFGRWGGNLAASDYANDYRPSLQYFNVAMRSALVSDTTVWHALAKMFRTRFNGVTNSDLRLDLNADNYWGINRELQSTIENIFMSTPWKDTQNAMSPGSILRMDSIMAEYNYFNIVPHTQFLEPCQPLMSQPIVELCLSVPMYVWQYNGRERGLARRAFSDCLTPEVQLRTFKNDGALVYDAISRKNKFMLLNYLLNGALIEKKILCRTDLERCIRHPEEITSEQYTFLLVAAGAEAWVQKWI